MEEAEYRMIPEITYVVFRKCSPGWVLPRNILPNHDITYVISGNASYTIRGKRYEVGPGDLLCVPPGSLREAFTSPDRLMSCFAVDFNLNNPDKKEMSLPFPLLSRIGKDKGLIRLFTELNYDWLERQPGYLLKIHGLLLMILHRLFELLVYKTGGAANGTAGGSADDSRIKKTIRYIAAHYPEKITVKTMASMTGLQTNYFNALFKQKTGLSMHQYLIRTRIRNAYNILLSGEYKVADIADRCGYSDVFHFYKQFKLIMGVSPSQCLRK
ncbi:hypothetical protein FACS189461_5360 [Spirochaetia bacterium]|nr:hypothetical protein FACS189461_5360 [Spirochaetia bacterium]